MFKILILLILIVSGCSANSSKAPVAEKVKTEVPQAYVRKYIFDSTNVLEDKVQKLELEYVLWGCACANWITPSDRVKYGDSGLAKHCIYIEPSDTSDKFPDNSFQFDKSNIIVEGRFYKRIDYPRGTYEVEGGIEKARVFRYTKLSVINKGRRHSD